MAPASPPYHALSDPERGSAPLFVSLFGLLAMMVISSLAGAVVGEYRQIDDGLLQIRAYWAAQGQAQYVLSRIRQDGACGTGQRCQDTPAELVKNYLVEVQTALSVGGKGTNGIATWIYPEISTSYRFDVSGNASSDPAAPSGKGGEFLLQFAFVPGSGNLPDSLRLMAGLRPTEVRFCTVGAQGLPCGCVVVAAPYGCERATDATTPYQNITSVHRPPRPAKK